MLHGFAVLSGLSSTRKLSRNWDKTISFRRDPSFSYTTLGSLLQLTFVRTRSFVREAAIQAVGAL